MYASSPSSEDITRIKWFEYSVLNRTNDFLADPDWFVMEWEDLTHEEFPDRYLEEFPLEIDGWFVGPEGSRGVKGVSLSILPLTNHKGEEIQYPETRQCFYEPMPLRKVFILKQSVYDALVPDEEKVPA